MRMSDADKWKDPDAYEEQGYRQSRKARLARHAEDAAKKAAWAAQSDKPMRERQFFGFGEIADRLARKPGSLEIDTAERERILHDLDGWIRRGEFDLTGDSDVVILIGEPPYLTPLGPLLPLRPGEVEIPIDPDLRMLRRGACRRYIEANSSLTNAASTLQAWLPENHEGELSPWVSAKSGRLRKVTTLEKLPSVPESGAADERVSSVEWPAENELDTLGKTRTESVQQTRPRARYKGPLAEWMAPQKLSNLKRMGAAKIACNFKLFCEKERGDLLPMLPSRPRSMEPEIERIMKRREEATIAKKPPSKAIKGQ
jgi:hypothetical protein